MRSSPITSGDGTVASDTGDACLVRICHSVEEAVGEIDRFYSNYVAFEIVASRGRLETRRAPTEEQLAALAALVPRFAKGAGFEVEPDGVITFNFEGRDYVNLRRVINEVNSWLG